MRNEEWSVKIEKYLRIRRVNCTSRQSQWLPRKQPLL